MYMYTTPFDHAHLSVKKRLLQCSSIGSCKTSCPLSRVKRCPLFRGSFCISYNIIGRSAGAWVRGLLDGGVRYSECPL